MMLEGIGKTLKFLFWGLFFSVFFIYSCTQRTITSIGESSVNMAQVHVAEPTFNIKDYGSMVDVDTDVSVSTEHKLQDFTATLHLYDCANSDTPVANCKEIGSDYEKFDGVIEAGSHKDLNWIFKYYSLPDRTGVLVPKLELTELRG